MTDVRNEERMSTEELVQELKAKIIAALNLEDIIPDDIDQDKPLFEDGLGLDSIDALEMVVMLEKDYGITVEDIEVTKQAFASVSALAAYVAENRSK
jgi:acyl carrier protein